MTRYPNRRVYHVHASRSPAPPVQNHLGSFRWNSARIRVEIRTGMIFFQNPNESRVLRTYADRQNRRAVLGRRVSPTRPALKTESIRARKELPRRNAYSVWRARIRTTYSWDSLNGFRQLTLVKRRRFIYSGVLMACVFIKLNSVVQSVEPRWLDIATVEVEFSITQNFCFFFLPRCDSSYRGLTVTHYNYIIIRPYK